MFLVLRCGQNCSILVWPPQRPCDLHLTKTKIYLPKLPSMLNLKSIRPLGAVVQHRLSKEPDFAIPLSYLYLISFIFVPKSMFFCININKIFSSFFIFCLFLHLFSLFFEPNFGAIFYTF